MVCLTIQPAVLLDLQVDTTYHKKLRCENK